MQIILVTSNYNSSTGYTAQCFLLGYLHKDAVFILTWWEQLSNKYGWHNE